MRGALYAMALAILLGAVVARYGVPGLPAPGTVAVAPGPAGPQEGDGAPRVDDGQERTIFGLARRLAILEEEVAILRERLARLESGGVDGGGAGADGGLRSFDQYDAQMLLAERREINEGLTVASRGDIEAAIGALPAEGMGDECGEVPDGPLKGLLELRDVGPFRARMVGPALDSLEQVFARVREDHPDLYDRLQSFGSFCARLVRGSASAVSRHSYGLAIDVSVGGVVDDMGDGTTQMGLVLLGDYFAEEGWIWGAGFGREDSMHFEVSRELLARWRAEGLL